MRPELATRYRALDVLRGVAVVLVLMHHTVGLERLRGPLAAGAREVMRVGWVGVDLFFVLSGFLVGGLLISEWQERGTLRLGRFYTRRSFKIYPPYLVLLAVGLAGHLLVGRGEPGFWSALAVQVAYLQNYQPGMFGHTWSLAVEEHFYLVLPWVLLLMAARRNGADAFRPLRWLVPLVGLATLGMRCGLALVAMPADVGLVVHPTHLRLDALMWGVLLAYFYHVRRAELRALVTGHRRELTIATAVLLAPNLWLTFHNSRYMCTFGLTTNAIGFLLCIALVLFPAGPERRGGPFTNALARLGVVSYSVYLWHMLVVLLWGRVATRLLGEWEATADGVTFFNLVYLVLAIGVGEVLYRLVEVPCLRWRDRLYPSRSGALAPVPRAA